MGRTLVITIGKRKPTEQTMDKKSFAEKVKKIKSTPMK